METRVADPARTTDLQGAARYRQRSWWQNLFALIRRKPLGAVGALIILTMGLTAIAAPYIAPHDPLDIDSSVLLVGPQPDYPLGTDDFGRDILSRLIFGARISLQVGLLAVGLGTTTGAMLGLVGGYVGGRLDFVIQRVMDSLMAFPMLVLALAMVAALGPSLRNVILALAVVMVPNSCRVVRSSVLSVREVCYVEAARAVGCPDLRVMFRHILPNCLAPYIIMATAGLGSAILSEASLSFLGLGTPAPAPSWGSMLSGTTQQYMYDAPWLAVFPGMAITLAVFGFNFLGDALRDILDPRLRGQ